MVWPLDKKEGKIVVNRRSILAGCAGVVATTLASPTLARTAVAGPDSGSKLSPIVVPPMSMIHPDLRSEVPAFVDMLRSLPPLNALNLSKRRETVLVRGALATDIPYQRRIIPGPKGNPELAVLAVNLGTGNPKPAIVHMHGGGMIRGSAFEHIGDAQDLARALDCVVVSVDYRLAPETTFTGSVEDNYAALKWLYANREMLGVDGQRIAVLGESAGGGHAALLAIAARDRGEVPLCFQCLVYPMLDDRTGSSRKVPPHIGTLLWTEADNRFGWGALLGVRPGTDRVPVQGVPARVKTVEGLPPAFIGVGGLDLFLEEDVDFAMRLSRAGIPCELVVVNGAFHAFDRIAKDKPISKWFVDARVDALRRAFA